MTDFDVTIKLRVRIDDERHVGREATWFHDLLEKLVVPGTAPVVQFTECTEPVRRDDLASFSDITPQMEYWKERGSGTPCRYHATVAECERAHAYWKARKERGS